MSVRRVEKPYPKEEILASLSPLVREWFTTKFQDFSPPQRFSIQHIKWRENTLLCSPTGTGKTLSAFLAVLDELIRASEDNRLEERVHCIYVSPLKALGNDIEKNLVRPLREMELLSGKDLGVRVGIRTGDTTASERARMRKKPPHILITTPESLAIMLASPKFSAMVRGTEYVIVDEIHALAENKRGVQLNVVLERLARHAEFTRIGLSATVAPLEKVAEYLVGPTRDCTLIDVSHVKKMDIEVMSPADNLIAESVDQIHKKQYQLIHDLVQKHTTTLIFTNTRSATERVVHNLKARYPRDYSTQLDAIDDATDESGDVQTSIQAHHGSLSKERRLAVEEALREGKLKCVVSSTSLELGIDIGYVDLVILLGSPKSVSRTLQRIGRSGHKLHEEAKGRIIVTSRDDLVECTALAREALEGHIDTIHIPRNCLDVLAQEIYAFAIEDRIHVQDIYRALKKSYCYAELTYTDFSNVLRYLAGGYATLEERHVYAKIWHDEETGMIGRKGRTARVLYMTNTGTIPDQTNVIVKIGEVPIGSISEPFLESLKPNDVFVLGGETYQFRYSRGMTAQVSSAVGKRPTVPSWFSDMLPLSWDVAQRVRDLRSYVHDMIGMKKTTVEIARWIQNTYPVDEAGALSIANYLRQQHLFSHLPRRDELLIEYFHDSSRKYAVLHTTYGRRVNDVLSRGLAFVAAKMGAGDTEISITDNGFVLRYKTTLQAARALQALRPDEIDAVLESALSKTEVLSRRFRHCAGRALMILRRYKGRTKTVGRQQVSTQILLATLRNLGEEFPILKEARREVLEDLMDIVRAREVLEDIASGRVRLTEKHTGMPSPMSFALLMTGYTDILRAEERHEFLLRMHKEVLAKIALKQKREAMSDIMTAEDYQSLWEEDQEKKAAQKEESQSKLRAALIVYSRDKSTPPQHTYDTGRLIDGERRFSRKYLEWLRATLENPESGLPTELHVYLADHLDEISWQ